MEEWKERIWPIPIREENELDGYDHLENDWDPTAVSKNVESIGKGMVNGSADREMGKDYWLFPSRGGRFL